MGGHPAVCHVPERVGDRQRHGKHVLVLHEVDHLVAVGDDNVSLVSLRVGLQHLLDDVRGDGGPVRLAVFLRRGRLQVLHDVALAVAGRAEALAAVGALEGLGARVEAHVHLQTALGGEGRAAHVAVERLLSYKILHYKSTLFCIQILPSLLQNITL